MCVTPNNKSVERESFKMGQKNSAYFDPMCSLYQSRCTQVGVFRPILLLYSDHQKSSVVPLVAQKYEEPVTLLLL